MLNPHDNSLIANVAEAGRRRRPCGGGGAEGVPRLGRHGGGRARAILLLKLADAIEADAEELAPLETIDTGHPIRDSRELDVPRTAVASAISGAWPTSSRAPSFRWMPAS